MIGPLLDGPALAQSLGRPEKTLRNWASRGLIKRHGHDAKGRTLFDVDEVIAVHEQRRVRAAPTCEVNSWRCGTLGDTDRSTTRVPGASTS